MRSLLSGRWIKQGGRHAGIEGRDTYAGDTVNADVCGLLEHQQGLCGQVSWGVLGHRESAGSSLGAADQGTVLGQECGFFHSYGKSLEEKDMITSMQ